MEELKSFSTTSEGKRLKQSNELVLVDYKVKYFEIKALVKDSNNIDQRCYNFTENFKETASEGLKSIKYASEAIVQR